MTKLFRAALVAAALALPAIAVADDLKLTGPGLVHPAAKSTAFERSVVAIGSRTDGAPFEAILTLPDPKPAGAVPVVVLFHGGISPGSGDQASRWQVFHDWGVALAAHGVATVMFDHSLGYPDRRLNLALSEADAVLSWLKEKGGDHGLDTARVTSFSFSAGGLLVAELLSPDRPLRPARAVIFYGSTAAAPGSAVDTGAEPRMSLVDAAPRIGGNHIPVMMIRGGGDNSTLLANFDLSVAALLRSDTPLEVINLSGAPHGFDTRTPTPSVVSALGRAIEFAARP